MDRYNGERYDYGDNRAHNRARYGNEEQNWHGREMSRDYDHLHQYPQNNQNHQRHDYDHPNYGSQYRQDNSSFQDRDRYRQDNLHQENNNRFSQPQYRRDQDGPHSYQNNYSRDRDQFGNQYQSDFRQDPTLPRGGEDDDLMGNIRQGYGISSYDGTSDRFNTLDSKHRYGSHQDEQAYYSNDRDGYGRAQFGGGLGESGMHSHRGIPDYGLHNFADTEGTGLGSSYGGANYGGGRGYAGGHRGGTLGNSSYGSYSGNYSGFGPGGSTYGGGRSSFGDTAHNSDRGTTELGGF